LATSESAVEKKPRLRLTMRRSSSVSPFGSFQSAMIGVHADLLRHPVVGAGVEILLPGPVVFEGHQLIEIGAAVDDALVVDMHPARAHGERFQAGGAARDRFVRARPRQNGILDRQIALRIGGAGEGIGIDAGRGPGSRHERGIVDQPQSGSRMGWAWRRLGRA
jgi:hypothetical protein